MAEPEQDAPMGEQHEPPTTAELVKHAGHAPDAQALKPMHPLILSDDEMRRAWRVASALAASRMFKDTTQAEQAFAKILIGRDLGLSPTQAMQTLDLVKGNIQMRGVLLLSFVRKSADYDYRVVEHTDATCSVDFARRDPAPQAVLNSEAALLEASAARLEAAAGGQELSESDKSAALRFYRSAAWLRRGYRLEGTSTFTIEDAQRAKLVKGDSAWETHPGNMLMWRTVSNGVKFFCPDLLGGVPVYTEADDMQERPVIGAGESEGEQRGLELGPQVEAVLRRAQDLGHDGFADRAAAEMAVGDQPPAFVVEWCKRANAELDAMEPADAETVPAAAEQAPDTPTAEAPEPEPDEVVDAEPHPDTEPQPPPAQQPVRRDPHAVELMRAQASQLADFADALEGEGKAAEAEEARDRAAAMMVEVDAASDPQQSTLGDL